MNEKLKVVEVKTVTDVYEVLFEILKELKRIREGVEQGDKKWNKVTLMIKWFSLKNVEILFQTQKENRGLAQKTGKASGHVNWR